MNRVDFVPFSEADQQHLEYAVTLAFHQGKWLFVKHCERDTLEIPGGRRENGESILKTAHRELYEETGATQYHLVPLTAYQVSTSNRKSFGLLSLAWVEKLGPLPDSEIDKVVALDTLPTELTYPTIQPTLFEYGLRHSALLRKIGNYDHVIWDWNGTLLNDVDICVQVIGDLLADHGLPRVSVDDYKAIFGFPVINYYQKLGFDFSRFTFEEVGDQFMRKYREQIKLAPLFEGVPATLELLSKRGVLLSILSAASQPHLEEALNQHGIRPYLNHVFGIDNHYAAGKLQRGLELMRAVSTPASRTLLVGDTDHDLEVGKALGVDVLLIADGHQHFDRLSRLHSNALPSRFFSG